MSFSDDHQRNRHRHCHRRRRDEHTDRSHLRRGQTLREARLALGAGDAVAPSRVALRLARGARCTAGVPAQVIQKIVPRGVRADGGAELPRPRRGGIFPAPIGLTRRSGDCFGCPLRSDVVAATRERGPYKSDSVPFRAFRGQTRSGRLRRVRVDSLKK
jgi:hypothetical protein